MPTKQELEVMLQEKEAALKAQAEQLEELRTQAEGKAEAGCKAEAAAGGAATPPEWLVYMLKEQEAAALHREDQQ